MHKYERIAVLIVIVICHQISLLLIRGCYMYLEFADNIKMEFSWHFWRVATIRWYFFQMWSDTKLVYSISKHRPLTKLLQSPFSLASHSICVQKKLFEWIVYFVFLLQLPLKWFKCTCNRVVTFGREQFLFPSDTCNVNQPSFPLDLHVLHYKLKCRFTPDILKLT